MDDLREFKEQQEQIWQAAAPGWSRWYQVLDAPESGGALTAKILEGAQLQEGDEVLDVGTGYGEPGLSAAAVVGPKGRAVLTDLSSQMLAAARERAADASLENVEFVAVDGDDLAFDPESFDAVLSRHGLQFLADVPAALGKIHGFLKSGGRLSATVWGPEDRVAFEAVMPVLADALSLPPPPEGPGANALADVEKLTGFLEGAGFGDVQTGTLTVTYELESPEQTNEWLLDLVPPIGMMTADLSDEDRAALWKRVSDEAWGRFVSDGGRVRLPCEAIWVTATK